VLNLRRPLLSFVSAVVLSCGIAIASPSTVSAADATWAGCGADGTVTIASGGSVALNITGCTGSASYPAIAKWSTGSGVTGSNVAKFTVGENVYQSFLFAAISVSSDYPEVSFTSSVSTPVTAYITTCNDADGSGDCGDGPGETATTLTVTVTGGGGGGGAGGGGAGGGSSSSSNPGCEVAGKPCKVRPWPWAVARTDHVILTWEALIDAEAGTGGVTSYRVESTPAGGTCILRLSEVPAGESLPTTCNITGLEPDTDYTFTVYASSAYGEGPGQSTQEAVRLLAAATPAVTVPAVTPETPAPTLPATGQQTVLVGVAVLLIGLGALATLSVRRRHDLNQMAQAVRHP